MSPENEARVNLLELDKRGMPDWAITQREERIKGIKEGAANEREDFLAWLQNVNRMYPYDSPDKLEAIEKKIKELSE